MDRNNNKRITIRSSTRLRIAAGQRYDCNKCKNCLSDRFEIDHIIHLCKGGENSLENLQALCSNCHSKKTSDDMQKLYDKNEEIKTGKSRFFNPMAFEYLGNKSSNNRIKSI